MNDSKEKLPVLLSRCYAPAVQSRLSDLPSRDQLPIAHWLLQNPIGTNYALQILERLEDLARREEAAPAKLLFHALGSLQTDKLQPKEIGRRVRDELDRLMHPRSAEHGAAFQDWLQPLPLPPGAKLTPPQNFEGRQFNWTLPFASTEELKQKLRQSLDLLDHPEWEKIWKF